MTYACPMHPEVRQEAPGKCPKCGMDLVKEGKTEDKDNHKGHQIAGLAIASDFLRRFLIVTLLLIPLILLSKPLLSLLGLGDFFLRRYLQFSLASAIFYFALVFFSHARHEISSGKYGMMTLVSLAVGAGYLFSAGSTFIPALKGVEFYLEISTLIWVLLFGHYLEARSSSAAGDALQEVAKLLPQEAHLLKAGEVKEVKVAELKKGDLVLVKAGEKIPADGLIIEGKASLDEALISGESKPKVKKKDDQVVAGSICLDGSLTIKLMRIGENSTIGQIKKLISQAQQTKPKVQKIADQAAGHLTLIALSVALLTILVWSLLIGKPLVFGLTLGITVLVIACPHALGLAIPTVSTIATSLAVKNGIFLKDLAKLEVVKDIDYVVFDKTGTLTKGEFGVTDIENLALRDKKEVLQIAASIEQHSSHVIASAIKKAAAKEKIRLIKVKNFKYLTGRGAMAEFNGRQYSIGSRSFMEEKGVLNHEGKKFYEKLSSEGKTVVFLADKDKVVAVFALADQIKKESFMAVSKLHRLGIKVAMLTGDSQSVAKTVARQLKIDDYFAQVLPEEKHKYIKKLQEKNNKVMMVGDGINDAPALTQADVGVAIGAGTDVAVEAGDIVLTRNNPEDVVRLLVLGKKVYRKMVENLVWATGYNLVAIPAAAGVFAPLGFFLRPEIGAILMSLSSVMVVINALSLKKTKLES